MVFVGSNQKLTGMVSEPSAEKPILEKGLLQMSKRLQEQLRNDVKPMVRCGSCRFWRTQLSFDPGWGKCDHPDFFSYHAATLNESHRDTACPLGEGSAPNQKLTVAQCRSTGSEPSAEKPILEKDFYVEQLPIGARFKLHGMTYEVVEETIKGGCEGCDLKGCAPECCAAPRCLEHCVFKFVK